MGHTAELQILIRRGTAAAWTSANPTLGEGELGYETDTGFYKWGDGATAWTSLSYNAEFGGSVTATNFSGPIGDTVPASGTFTTLTSNGLDDDASSVVLTLIDGGITVTGLGSFSAGVDNLATSTGIVKINTAAAPVAGAALVATSPTTAEWSSVEVYTPLSVTSLTYTADEDNNTLLVDDDTAGGAVTVTLPEAHASGDYYVIKKLGTTGNVNVAGFAVGSAPPILVELEPVHWSHGDRPQPGEAEIRKDHHWSVDELELYCPAHEKKLIDYGKYKQQLSIEDATNWPIQEAHPGHGGLCTYFGTHSNTWFYTFFSKEPDVQTNLTMACFITTPDPGLGDQAIMSLTKDVSSPNSSLTLSVRTEEPPTAVAFDYSGGDLYGTTTIVPGQTYHVCVTFDEANTEKKLYVNGVLEATDSSCAATFPSDRNRILLGVEDKSRVWEFSGWGSEFRFYKRTLDADEVYQLAHNRNISLVPVENELAWTSEVAAGTPDNIDGASPAVLTAQYEALNIVSDGTEWHVI